MQPYTKKTPAKNWKSFFYKIILPTILTIIMFIASFFFFLIPSMEENLLKEKRLMIKELTSTALSLIDEYYQQELSGELSRSEAQKLAIAKIGGLRYGSDNKDYFWIFDSSPRMIMHPYKPQLNGKDVTDYTDRHGKRIFVEFSRLVNNNGKGYLQYMWQLRDQEDLIVRKISYVEEFKEWKWIVGTGIYTQDISSEINRIKNSVLLISVIIIVITMIFLVYILFQGVSIEKRRIRAEGKVIESKNKYKALVEASNDGFILFFNSGHMICNQRMQEMLGYSQQELNNLSIEKIIPAEKNDVSINELDKNSNINIHFDGTLIKKDNSALNVVFAISSITVSEKRAIIIIARDISIENNQQTPDDRAREDTIVELQSALLFLNQGITDFSQDILFCDKETPVTKAANIMSQKNQSAILVADNGIYTGIVTDYDIRNKFANKVNNDCTIDTIMSSPLITISEKALVFEALQKMDEYNLRHLLLEKDNGKISQMLSSKDLLKIQGYSALSIIESIKKSTSIDEIKKRHDCIPKLVTTILKSGGKSENLARLIARVADTITVKIIEFAIDELGPPPIPFSFIIMGSEGREEQTLNTDQDNAIIYADPPEEQKEEVHKYFSTLAIKVCTWLDQVGYDFCEGEIMAMNPKWCQSLSDWKKTYHNWIWNSSPQDLLDIQIFFDFKGIYGCPDMPEELRQSVFNYIKENLNFMTYFARDALTYRPPLTMFGNIATKNSKNNEKTFNIKSAMRTIINFARIYSLKERICARNTFERLKILHEKQIISEVLYIDIIDAYDFLMELRLKHQAKAAIAQKEINNNIAPDELTKIEKMTLKKVFSQINTFQSKITLDFRGARDGIA
ncbi:MAG: CBS domain-containing protein [Gammaproteobacteria bacterium]|nr:MAG: CBS domain-containing protein [Gammaproteobacteria bacterium]